MDNPSLRPETADATSSVSDTAGCYPNEADQPRSKRHKRADNADVDTNVDTNTCCVCFETYEDDVVEGNGREWIECSCGRWLHEDCSLSESAMPDEFCPYCVR